MLTGCGSKGLTAVESAGILFDMYIKQDKSKAEKLPLKKEEIESILEQENKALKAKIKSNFTTAGLKISDEDLDKVCKAQLAAMAKVTSSIELVSEKDGISEVKVKSTYVDILGADNKAGEDAANVVEKSGITDQQELLNKVTTEYINNLINELNSLEPSTDTKEKTFKFKKDEKSKVYLPENIVEFSVGICEDIVK
ncbi:hypothetical protein UT300005_30200 [Clostridium sp. CTA-5]